MFGIPAIFIGPIITVLVSLFKRIPFVDTHPKLIGAILAGGATVVSAILGQGNPAADLLTGLSSQIGSLPAAVASVAASTVAITAMASGTHELVKPVSDAIAGKSSTSSPLQGT